jgi:hypothetical protein
VGLIEKETQALRSPQLARVGVHEAGLMGGGGKYILNHLYGLSLRRSYRTPGPDWPPRNGRKGALPEGTAGASGGGCT